MKFSSNAIILFHVCVGSIEPALPARLPYNNAKLAMPLSSSLNALKDSVSSDGALGPIKRDQQRLFYLGRELKSGNRSLGALGIGNHGVYTIHLLSLAPRVVDLLESHDVKDTVKSGVDGKGRRNGDVAGSASRPTVGGDGIRPVGRQRQRVGEKVVELLDSDSDNDDDDVVEVIETTSKRRRRS